MDHADGTERRCAGTPAGRDGRFAPRRWLVHASGCGVSRQPVKPSTRTRCKAIDRTDWGAPRETHRRLCDDCKQRAITAERQPQQPAPEHQKQDQAVPEQKAGGGTLLQLTRAGARCQWRLQG